jgi:hypothetical protein
MIRHHTHRLWLLLYAIVAALVLTGCSGGGGGGGSPAATQPDNSSTVSGTAAAGAPLVGFVGAKDSTGGASTADILPDGSFELDITDLTPPVLIYASGIAGGNAYQLLSVVFEDDVNGTVNITPITDLIIGNTVSDSPQAFFNNPNFTVLTQEAVEAEEENLKKRLKPLLDGLGVEADFDLRNSTFVANRSGFDGVLDILEVTVNGGTAIIRNRVDPTNEITNTFSAPEQEVITVSENLQSQVDTLDILDTLASNFAAALDNEDGPALEGLVTNDYLNNGEDIAGLQVRLFGSPEGIEDAGELANDIRNWSLVTLDTAGGTAQLNIGAPQGPWNVVNVDGDWKIQGNQLEYFAFVEPTHLIESGAETPAVIEIGTLIYAGFQIADLGSIEDSSVTISGDLAIFNGDLPVDSQNAQRFADFQVLAPGSIASGDQVTFAWNNGVAGIIDSEVTFTLRRGAPDFTNGAPRITGQSADLDADAYSFEWTLPPGYDAISVRNNFTGQTSGGQGSGFTGNPLDNDATSFTGNLPETYLPSADDELRLIARDPFGVFVAARLKNPFADQVPPPMAEDALIGSWIVRNTERADNAPFIQLTFLESGYYMHQELDQPYRTEADDSGNTGIEFGRYEWDNQTGELTVPDIIIDDNGSWGATDTASGEVRLALKVDDDTMTAYDPTVGIADGTVFTRVPLNESGITGSWLFQNSEDPSDFVVATLLEDGFYFVGSTTPAEPEFDTAVGLEFGTYTYNRETLVLNASPIFDQNGTAGLSTPSPQNFYFSTVVDGSLIFDEGVVAQLSELAPGVAPSNGDVTVDYVSPGDGTTTGPAVSGDFHYLRNVIGIEGSREFSPPTVFQGAFSYIDTTIADNGDGTGSVNWSGYCVTDLLVDANTASTPVDAVFDAASECLPSAGDAVENVAYTDSGLSVSLPAETITDPEDQSQIQLGNASLNMTAVDANRSLFIGQSVRDFGYEESNSFTDGFEVSAHVLAKKSAGRTVADLEGNWGYVARSLYDIDGPNDLGYETSSQIMNVDNTGVLSRVSGLDRRIVQALTANTFTPISVEIEPESTIMEALGPVTITDDGALDLLNGFGGGILSAGGNVVFGNFTNPITPVATPENDAIWFVMVRLSDTFNRALLDGKEYALISQNYWVEPEAFEVDYREPGATLSFPVGGGPVSLAWEISFMTVPFEENTATVPGGDPFETASLQYAEDANGRITLTTDFGEPGIVDLELNGFSSPDGRLLVFENTLIDQGNAGTGPKGGLGIIYAICTNCD